tara:strand:+ start:12 stop:1409 length:1398 start_codon:yes stop_codon:yes gene_type:complete
LKKTIYAFLSWLLSFCASAQSLEEIASLNANDIRNLAATFGIPSTMLQANYGVDVYRVIYNMPYLNDTIEVSGALFMPTGIPEDCGLPINTYMHGTIFERNQAPSFMSVEGILGYFMSTSGYITIMPDYVGLGTSMLMHPYVHAKSEAEAGVFLLETVLSLTNELNFSYNDELFISGYSQGGHAAMAMAREIQENWSNQYEVTACAPMSGPYDMSGIQAPFSMEVESYPSPAYFVYNVLGWNNYYGNIYDDLADIFQEPFASIIPDLFDGETGPDEINNALPTLSSELIQPGIVEEILNDFTHPYMIAAVNNDVYDWMPTCQMQIYYCEEDAIVFPENAFSAFNHMVELGAENISLFNSGALDHGGCAGPSIFEGLIWMDQFHTDCVSESVAEFASGKSSWSIAPNPALNGSTIILGGPINARWTVRDISGRMIATGTSNTIELGTTSGIYFIELEGNGIKRILN